MLGTGFDDGAVGSVGFVKSYGSFVGGFISNESSIAITGIELQAICGQVAGGSTVQFSADAAHRSEIAYHARLEHEVAR